MAKTAWALLLTALAGCVTANNSLPVARPDLDKRFTPEEAMSALANFAQQSLTEDSFLYSVRTGKLRDIGINETEDEVEIKLSPLEISIELMRSRDSSASEAIYWEVHNHPAWRSYLRLCEGVKDRLKRLRAVSENLAAEYSKTGPRSRKIRILNLESRTDQFIKAEERLEVIVCSDLGLVWQVLPSAYEDAKEEIRTGDLESQLQFSWMRSGTDSANWLLRELIGHQKNLHYLAIVTGKEGYTVTEIAAITSRQEVLDLSASYKQFLTDFIFGYNGPAEPTRQQVKDYFQRQAWRLQQKTEGRIKLSFYYYSEGIAPELLRK